MPAIKLLADMNISPLTISGLRKAGWDIARVSDYLPATVPDEEVLHLVRIQGRVIITHDIDYSTLLAVRGYSRPSVITIRFTLPTPDYVLERLLEVLPQIENDLSQGAAITLEESSIRVWTKQANRSRRISCASTWTGSPFLKRSILASDSKVPTKRLSA